MLWDPFLYCINDSIQGNSETGNKVFALPSEVSINTQDLSAYVFSCLLKYFFGKMPLSLSPGNFLLGFGSLVFGR